MKNTLVPLLIGLSAAVLLTGCACDFRFGGGSKSSTNSATNASVTKSDQNPNIGQQVVAPTLGQQLIDLQKARDSGAITDAEFQTQKAKLLQDK